MMTRLGALVPLLAALALVPAGPSVQAAEVEGGTLPPTLSTGDRSLPLRGCGVREAFFMTIYVAGLYLPRPGLAQGAILSPDTAKAVRLQITYDGSLPQEVPDSWRAPLDQMVRRDLQQTIAAIYADFQAGDQVTISYAPQAGTTVEVNGQVLRRTEGHELIRPLLRLWAGDRAVSPSLRQDLLGSSCGEGGDGWF